MTRPVSSIHHFVLFESSCLVLVPDLPHAATTRGPMAGAPVVGHHNVLDLETFQDGVVLRSRDPVVDFVNLLHSLSKAWNRDTKELSMQKY